ncbi:MULTISPECIES: SpoIIE family protein phosphatase [Streptomyces]|uniref:SpoIIE family protein phosphatase n=1 Tax=Streptomyces lycopersici TaxID=2974589 RepID=UPI0021D0F6C6|nr:SpoIIE family protein phosphatase [Streptomyces sp. NEAU-383]
MSSARDDDAALAEAHERLLSGRIVGKAVRESIQSSWQRCNSMGLTADRLHATYTADVDIAGKLTHVARPVLDQLETRLAGVPATIFLTDERARLLQRRAGEPSLNRRLESLQLAPGFGIPEELVGTNGIGTALVTTGPAFVCGREHFADAWSGLACAGAPVRDPFSGQVLGVLDLTCLHLDADPTMADIVAAAARSIEERLLDGVSARERALLETYQNACGVGVAQSGSPIELLDPRDRRILQERATELISSGRTGFTEVPLRDGRAAVLLSRPIGHSSGVSGFSVEAAFPGEGVYPLLSQAPYTGSPDTDPGVPCFPTPGPAVVSAPRSPTPAVPAERWLLAVGEPGIGQLALHARQRLGLIADAGFRIGTTLDVSRTAEELTGVVVPRFADFAAVDLPDSVLLGEEPIRVDGPLRRAAIRGAHEGAHLYSVDDVITFHPSMPQAQALATGEPVREPRLSEAPGWIAHDPVRGSKILGAGVHSLIAVPMLARGTVLGVVSFYRSKASGSFEEDDLVLAEELVGRAAVCIDNARRFTREQTMALMLQRSMLPSGMPAQHAVEVAHRYLPAKTGVRGDWFDVIPLSGARVALVVGDIVGHGMHAAATMGRLRTAVHNFSALDLATDEILTQLDDLVIRFDLDDQRAGKADGGIAGASCLYAVYDPSTRRCTLGRAGHLPPAVVLPDGTVEFPHMPVAPPLGVGGLPFETVDVELPEGSLVVLYTDGLIDHLGQCDVDRGLAHLLHVLAETARTPEEVCEALGALLPADPSDDIAVLVARTRAFDTSQFASWDLPSDPAVVSRVRADVNAQLAEWDIEDLGFTTELVVSELVTNAIRYGAEPIQLRLLQDSTLICEVADGSSIAPRMRRAHTTDENGRGLFLVAQLAQRWGTRYTTSGKVIWAEQPLPGRSVQ